MTHFDSDTLFNQLLNAKLQVDGARGLIHEVVRQLVHLVAEAERDGRYDEAAEYSDDARVLRYTRLSR